MTTLALPFAATAAARPGLDIGPAARTAISLACFTLSFLALWALARWALGLAPDVSFYAKLPIVIHVAAVLPTIPLGGWLLLAKKGTPMHRSLGKVWMGLMVVTALSAIFIKTSGSFSWIHLFVPLTLHAAWKVMQTARKGDIRAHKAHLVRTYLTALLIPGLFAFALPGRLMHVLAFG
ncbi:DUF2306 domain-containing protein [Erythrobacter sp. NE805]|uniref:DUF2306 domain-containing protein n=1 Tax=Erythrobacter sp. NE805 TaxID=3389875 RepID=UPI00396B1E69